MNKEKLLRFIGLIIITLGYLTLVGVLMFFVMFFQRMEYLIPTSTLLFIIGLFIIVIAHDCCKKKESKK